MKQPPALSFTFHELNFLKTGGEAEPVYEFVERLNKVIRRNDSTIYKDIISLAEKLVGAGVLVKDPTNIVQLYDSPAEKFPRIPELPPIVTNPNVTVEVLTPKLPTPSKYLGIIDQVPYADESLTKSQRDQLVVSKFYQLKVSADNRGKDFDLTIDDVRKLLRKKRCAYTGVLLVDSKKPCAHTRTIDRIDPKKGYVPGNVVAVTTHANHIKNMILEDPTSAVYTPFSQLLKMTDKLLRLGFTNETDTASNS